MQKTDGECKKTKHHKKDSAAANDIIEQCLWEMHRTEASPTIEIRLK